LGHQRSKGKGKVKEERIVTMPCYVQFSKRHAGHNTTHFLFFFPFVDLLTPPSPHHHHHPIHIQDGNNDNNQNTDRTAQAERRHACGAEVPKKEKAREGASKMAVPPAAASGVDPLRLLITGLRTMLLLLSLWELALSNFLPGPPRLAVAGTVSGLMLSYID